MSLRKTSRLGLAALVFGSLVLCLFWACIPTQEKGHTYFEIKADTAWAKYDTLILSWKDPASTLGGDLFTGRPDAFGSSQKVLADGYLGQTIEITVKGVRAGKTVHVEVLQYNGTESKVEATRHVVAEGTNLDYDASPITLGEKDSAILPEVKVTPENLFDKSLQWSSSNPLVFVVEGGRIIAKGSGSATLTGQLVSDPARIFAISVTVGVFTAPVEKVEFETETLTLLVGATAEIPKVIVTPDNADPRVEFSSSDETKARIENGRIVGLIPGDVCMIVQSRTDAGKKDTLTVTVLAAPDTGKPIPVAPTMISLSAGDAKATVAWAPVEDATQYNLYYAAGTSVSLAGTKLPGVLSPKSVTGLTECVDYTFAATAANAKGESALSANPLTAMVKSAQPFLSAASGNSVKCVADKADFSVTATGSGTLSYQWRKDTVSIPGATSAVYSIPSVTFANAGSYTCVVGNGCSNKVTSAPAVLAVKTPPLISANLSNPPVQHPGNSLTFQVTAIDTAPLSYQWRRNGNDISGETANSLSLPMLTIADNNAVFTCVVSNGCGSGVLSDSATVKVSAPAKISLGLDHFLLLLTDGSAWSAGYNFSGQLADGTNANRFTPTQILTGIKDVTAHSLRSFFLKNDGSISAAGYNLDGSLGIGTFVNSKSPVDVKSSSGTPFNDVAKIGKGFGGHTLFLKTNGTVWGCGSNNASALGRDEDIGFPNPIAIMTGPGAELSGIKDIASGLGHSLALAANGAVWAWGRNSDGQLGDGSDSERVYAKQVMTGVVKIAAGYTESYCLKADGSLWAAGRNQYGQFGNGTIASGSTFFQIASSISDVVSGGDHLLTKQMDGSVWASGSGLNGALGTGNDLDSHVRVRIFSTGVAAMDAGNGNSLFLMTNGILRGVGTAFSNTLKQVSY